MEIDLPEVVAEVTRRVRRYEQALVSNDVADARRDLPRRSAHHPLRRRREPLRLQGDRGVPRGALAAGLARTLSQTVITTYGRDFAVASTLFHRATSRRQGRAPDADLGRAFPTAGSCVAAHVSVIDEPELNCSSAMKARQPPKLEMSRAPATASASTRKPFTRAAVGEPQRADRQRRRHRGDEAAEGFRAAAPRLRPRSRRPRRPRRAAVPASAACCRRAQEPIVGRGRRRFEQARASARNSPLSGMPERCAPTTAIAISSARGAGGNRRERRLRAAESRRAAGRCRHGTRGRSTRAARRVRPAPAA